jgi:hypothetical protein
MRVIIACLLCLLISSCGKFTYIQETKEIAPGLFKDDKDFFVYENDTLRMVYAFWADGGVLAFSLYNKLSTPLYINWKRSSFVLNSRKMDYWREEAITNRITKNDKLGSSLIATDAVGSLLALSGSSSLSISREATVIPEKITFIAPQSYIFKEKFRLMPNEKINLKDQLKNADILRPKTKQVKGKSALFDDTNTPINFRNFLTISTSEDFVRESYIDHKFYVNKIIKIKSKDAIKKGYIKEQRKYGKINLFYNPSYFYFDVTEDLRQ